MTLLITCVLFFVLVGLYYAQRYQEVKTASFEQTAKQALHQLTYSEREYSNMRDQLSSIMDLLGHSQSLISYARFPTESSRTVLEEVWKSVLVNQKWYTKIRVLDLEGKETVRLDYSTQSRIVTLPDELADRSAFDYFKYAQTLESEEIGSWGIELERGSDEKVSYPYTPILRVLTPIVDEGTKLGYLVINVDVMGLASRLSYSPDLDFRVEAVNKDGFYISSYNKSKLYGDVIPERKSYNLANLAPDLWESLALERSGYVFEDDNLFAFNTVNLSRHESVYLLVQM
ncbi:diguanylate cyclase, partial [Vibrio makurazakiensis]